MESCSAFYRKVKANLPDKFLSASITQSTIYLFGLEEEVFAVLSMSVVGIFHMYFDLLMNMNFEIVPSCK